MRITVHACAEWPIIPQLEHTSPWSTPPTSGLPAGVAWAGLNTSVGFNGPLLGRALGLLQPPHEDPPHEVDARRALLRTACLSQLSIAAEARRPLGVQSNLRTELIGNVIGPASGTPPSSRGHHPRTGECA